MVLRSRMGKSSMRHSSVKPLGLAEDIDDGRLSRSSRYR